MAVYKVKATMSVDVEIEIEANSEDQAISRFIEMDAQSIMSEGNIYRADSEDETAELVEGTFKVHVSSVNYDVTFNDCWDIVVDEHPGIDENSDEFDELVYAKIDEIKKSLPQELDLEVTCAKEGLDDYVADAISEETNWLINSCEYNIVSVE